MAGSELRKLLPEAPRALCEILDGARGPVLTPIRSEIFGAQRFCQHGRSLGQAHRAANMPLMAATFFPRLKSNIRVLREAHRYIGLQATTGYDISPAAEWLLDNFHTIEAQLKEIHDGLPRSYFRSLPMLLDEPLAGLPRIYGVAWAFVAHTDGSFDEDLLVQFLSAYQEVSELKLSELWALPTTLRVVLIENLRRLAERVATNKAAREVANVCFDRIEQFDIDALNALLALMVQRGVGPVFLTQMAQRMQDRRATVDEDSQSAVHEWLRTALPDPGAALAQQAANQAADNLSVSNAVNALRAIGDANWSDVVAHTSALMRCMLTSALFVAEDLPSQDQTLHAIEMLAKRSGVSEVSVAHTLLALMQADGAADADPDATLARHWLTGSGRATLMYQLGLQDRAEQWLHQWLPRCVLPAYLLLLLGALTWLVGSLVRPVLLARGWHGLGWPQWAALAAMVLPASQALVAVLNRLISESVRPRRMARLALADGITRPHRVLVVIPGMLLHAAGTQELAHNLELHYLANTEPQAQFALLTDWGDAPAQRAVSDAALLAEARQCIATLNARYPVPLGDTTLTQRFCLLHRERLFSDSEQKWIGWERKRGKLEQLVTALATGDHAAFLDLGMESNLAKDVQYIVTLDSDTQLPPGRLRELVGVAAHPDNSPRLDASGRRVVGGYGILQPRILTPLPDARQLTPYHWLFAGQCGIDPYSAASSEVYQDLFSEGTFTGKGLLHVKALHAALCARLPEDQILSHDLLEGSIARCAAVTDIAMIEEAPYHADVAASRVHRWTRGDWQLLPILLTGLLHPKRYGIRAVNLWKMFDNLRRSLVAPMSLLFLLATLAGILVTPWTALALVYTAFCAGPLMGALAGFSPHRAELAKRHFFGEAFADLGRALCTGVWHVAQLLQDSLLMFDAIGRALYRMAISRRNLLQWTTAAVAQAQAKGTLRQIARLHWPEPVIALALLVALYWAGTAHGALALALCALWAASPVWTWWVSKSRATGADAELSIADKAYLEGIARDTWRLFERCVGEQDKHLPPDNLQLAPYDMVAHRTSPTNIGLYLLSVACARQFGWIGTQDLLQRLEVTLATLHTMQRHRGHFLNWYDTQTAEPLLPLYVSTVDSGNLTGHLLATAQACLELAQAPFDDRAEQRALLAARHRMDALLTWRSKLSPALREELKWLIADYRATRRSAALDAQAKAMDFGANRTGGVDRAAQRLRDMAAALQALAWEADYSFLYSRKRHLFHIGYRVVEQQRDAAFYDLLASESRLTSVLAIAKADVPVRHWAALGRPFFAVRTSVGLRSWTGSMFEYLMPSLVLAEPPGSVLHAACDAALREQMAFAKSQGVPWGISESAYAASDHTLAFQYAPQGVPRLALRRTPPDELVVAPYATAMAAQVSPRCAIDNFRAMQALGARGRYGFIEALDYSPARRVSGRAFAPVDTVMAHHQGMSIVALSNSLLGGVAQRWGMATASVEAVASLLHERVPREVSLLHAPRGESRALLRQRRRAGGLLREVLPGAAAVEPTHLLSNGRYSVSLRANGAGWSRWGNTGVNRQRDDALRDEYGSFLYLRGAEHAHPVSLTQHPAPDPAASYNCTFHADRVCFETHWSELQVRTTVWVSPEDDVEFRMLELRNTGDHALDIELLSAFDITLSDRLADEAHPAFANMFVQAHWMAAQQALLFERKPRLATEPSVQAAHFLTGSDAQVLGLRVQTDRLHWLGRNHTAARPLARLNPVPASTDSALQELATGLDPMCALAVQLRVAPKARVQLTFATAVSDNAATLRAVIDKYRLPNNVKRASLMSATLTGIRLRALRLNAENFAAMQTLSTALVHCLTRPQPLGAGTASTAIDVCDRRLLWRFGISGDKPLILISAGVLQGLGLLRSMAQALAMWSWGGVACDLVVVNSEPNSYLMALQREIIALRERHLLETAAPARAGMTGFHLLRADELSADELSTLKAHARIRLVADGRPLAHHVQEWIALHENALDARRQLLRTLVPVQGVEGKQVKPSIGAFVPDSHEFAFTVGASERPPKPWINVLSNPDFGAQLSEVGSGFSWAVNSRLNQLTAWSNDPVSDPPAEWLLLQDCKTLKTWSLSPGTWGAEGVSYHVRHGQGHSVISHQVAGLEVSVSWCVDSQTSVKQISVQLRNHNAKAMRLRLVGIAEWMMGANRSDRRTIHTSCYQHAQADEKLTVLMATQRERSAGYGQGTAFFSMAAGGSSVVDWTCDRRECFDERGNVVVPEHFAGHSGIGLDPCAALSARVDLAPDESVERIFLLGYAAQADAALQLAVRAAQVTASQRLQVVHARWDALLGTATVKTPDPLFDAMVNRWLLYQTVSCRLWAKAGFYQAGGATGFRDQLQDAMSLAWAAPHMLRQQIVQCASRQFEEGDVQHWWHAPLGAGVRTHFSDDLLWLPYACTVYLRATDDTSLLDQAVPFLLGAAIPAGAEDAYFVPTVSLHEASVYEHAARAIDRSLAVGAHGLPLMGSGDWNDGMNRVGIEGRGESVWLGWFLCRLVADFLPQATARGETARAQRWAAALVGWKAALNGSAWDGRWFKRAYFDDGQALGSHANPEARIDLIAQAWAVLSEAAEPAMQDMALQAIQSQLVDDENGLIRLLDPPLVNATPSAGYIQAYPPGVRENGGQYAHAGVWALMAMAAHSKKAGGVAQSSELPYRYFTYLSPAHRSSDPVHAAAYGLEPYAMAGDVYSQPPYVGRGGWSWYTGAAGWLHRAAIESIFGLQLGAQELTFQPCLPAHWKDAELTLKRDGRTMRFVLVNDGADQLAAMIARWGAQTLMPGQALRWTELLEQSCHVIPLK